MILESQKILIIGASGLLGGDLLLEMALRVPRDSILSPDSKAFDITNRSQIQEYFRKYRPTVVLNAAAYTNVDGAETERERAHAINALGPKNLVECCRELKAKLVHFSTDYVFSGETGRTWTEEDTPCPPTPNYYAETKLEAERYVASLEESLTVRVQWLYGKTRDRFSTLREKKTFTPFIDQIGSPSWTREIARTMIKLLERDVSGLFHFAYDDSTSWYEVYQLLKDHWGLSVELKPKRLADVSLPAKRPPNCVLSNKKLCNALGVSSMGSWKTHFLEFLK